MLTGSERVYTEMSLKDILGVRVTCCTTEAQGFNQKIEVCVPVLLIHSANLVKSGNCSGSIHSPIEWDEHTLHSPASVELTFVLKKNV